MNASRHRPPFVVGVDGGTTKTVALVADRTGRIVGCGRAGNSNWVGAPVEDQMAVVCDAVRQALRMAGVTGDDVALGVFGLAGADWPQDYMARERVLAAVSIVCRVIVQNDALVGWRAGSAGPYGVVTVAGTSTNTCVIAPDGRRWCYGYYVDDGGAASVAHDAVRAVLRAEDGRGAPTALTAAVLHQLDLPTPEALLRASYTNQLEPAALLALCPLVFETAASGDEVARAIIVRQGEVLAEYATAAIQRFDMAGLAFDLVLAGSLLKGEGPLLTDTISRRVCSVAPRVRVVRPSLEPAVGALLWAYDALSIETSEHLMEELARTTPDAAFFNTRDGRGVGERFVPGSRR